jgi:hypothetical protein
VASFRAAEAEWRERVEQAEERARLLGERVRAAEGGEAAGDGAAPASSSASSSSQPRRGNSQLTVEWQRDSALQQLITTAQMAVPIGLAAWGMFKLWTEYERRVLRR